MATNTIPLRCDGCGQTAASEHVARRLQRLEWTTRYRPIHIGTLFLGGVVPGNDAEFLYSPEGGFSGEAGVLLAAARVPPEGKTREAVLAEFQRGGFFLAHVLECPLDSGADGSDALQTLVRQNLQSVRSRIRRSLKPKSIVPISKALEPLLTHLQADDLGCVLIFDNGKPFALDSSEPTAAIARLRDALAAAPVR